MIYFLEDDRGIRELVIYTLMNTGFDAKGFERPSEFFSAVREEVPELILLDIMLPEEDGLSVLRKLRRDTVTKELPVMMLTAKDTEYDTVLGIESGADDYLAKPFGMMELVARIRGLLRRTGGQKEPGTYKIGDLVIDKAKHLVTVEGKSIELTGKEFSLLWYLMENQGVVLTRDQILNEVWGYDFDGETRTVDVHIRTLRQKLRDGAKCIETIRGVGYRIGDRI